MTRSPMTIPRKSKKTTSPQTAAPQQTSKPIHHPFDAQPPHRSPHSILRSTTTPSNRNYKTEHTEALGSNRMDRLPCGGPRREAPPRPSPPSSNLMALSPAIITISPCTAEANAKLATTESTSASTAAASDWGRSQWLLLPRGRLPRDTGRAVCEAQPGNDLYFGYLLAKSLQKVGL